MDTPDISKEYRKYYKQLEPTLSKPKTKAYSTIVFFFLVVSLFGWYAIRPTIQTILYLQREIADKSEINRKMDGKINTLIQAQSVFDANQEKLKYLDEAMPVEADTIGVLKQLRNLAGATQASFSAIRIGTSPLPVTATDQQVAETASKQAGKNNELAMTITLMGEYPALSAFLSGAVDMRRLITIDTIQINKDVKSGPEPVGQTQPLSITIKIKTYYTRQTAAASAKTP